MRIPGWLLDAVGLSCIGLGSMVLGFWVFRLGGSDDQMAVQLPVALIAGVVGMIVWLRRVRAGGSRRPGRVLLAVFPVSALLVVAGHFVVTGYLTALGNVIAAWLVLLAQMAVAVPATVGRGRADPARRI